MTYRIACLGIVFNEKGQILLLRRHQPNHHTHDMWNLPGGGLEFGEHPKEAVIREIKEEANIEAKLLSRHPYVYTEVREESKKQILLLGFLAEYVSGEATGEQDEGVSEARWFEYEEIDFTHTLPFTQEMIDDAMKHRKEGTLL